MRHTGHLCDNHIKTISVLVSRAYAQLWFCYAHTAPFVGTYCEPVGSQTQPKRSSLNKIVMRDHFPVLVVVRFYSHAFKEFLIKILNFTE